MGIWIRSQDKCKLIKCTRFGIDYYSDGICDVIGADCVAPMIRKRDLRDIYISENVKVTIDLEDVKKEIANQFYNPLRVGNIK